MNKRLPTAYEKQYIKQIYASKSSIIGIFLVFGEIDIIILGPLLYYVSMTGQIKGIDKVSSFNIIMCIVSLVMVVLLFITIKDIRFIKNMKKGKFMVTEGTAHNFQAASTTDTTNCPNLPEPSRNTTYTDGRTMFRDLYGQINNKKYKVPFSSCYTIHQDGTQFPALLIETPQRGIVIPDWVKINGLVYNK